MKRISNLYDQIISLDNLRRADEKARRGKLHTYGVKVHDLNREANLLALHDALLTKRFRTSPYEVFVVKEPKERLIYRLPYYPDRIVHHAIMNVLEPIWLKVFPYNTYSCIKGRGIHGAMKRVKEILRDKENSRYCLKIDIKKFYPSIVHDVAKWIIRRKIKCKDTLALLDEIIDSVNGYPDPLDLECSVRGFHDPRDIERTCQGRSLPIGNYISQYLANLILSYLVHKINEKKGIKGVVYADDGVFFSNSKEALHELCRFIDEYLSGVLQLTLKGNYQVFPIAENRYDKHGRGLDFVGFVFYHNQTQIRKTIKQNFCRAAARLNRRTPPVSVKEYKQGICSWLGWAKYSDSKHLLKTIIKQDVYGKL